jgi:transposase
MGRSTSRNIVKAENKIVSVGIDVSKEHFNVALCSFPESEAAHYLNADFDNTPSGIKAFLQLLKREHALAAHLCMEATGRYWELLAFTLNAGGRKVSVVNPARLKAYVRAVGWRTKTDKADAQYIAHFCAKQSPEEWIPPSPERRELQSLARHLEDLKRDRTRYLNRKQATPPSPAVRKSLDTLVQQLDEEIAHVEQEIEHLSSANDHFALLVTLLCTIPGIGRTTALRLLAEMPDIANFDSVRQLTAYAGLNPAIRQSGKSNSKGHLSRQGNKHIRAALFYAALSAKTWNPVVRALTERMLQNGKAQKQCIAAAMRKLLHIIYGVLKSNRPFDPALAANANLT